VQIIRHHRLPVNRPLALTIGNFDGVHLGHQILIRQLRQEAQTRGWDSAAMTFEPHPVTVLAGKPAHRIEGVRKKIQQLAATGLEILYLPRFNKRFASQSAKEFTSFLFTQLAVRHLVVGEDFRFGQGRQGDVTMLKKAAAAHGATVLGAELLWSGDAPISSGRIREYLRAGNFIAAAQLLGREWVLDGRVVRGEGIGRRLGFPTANLRLNFVPVCSGIFAGDTVIDGVRYPAAVSIGNNPTVQNSSLVRAEAHVLDFDGNLYRRRLTVQLFEKLRDEEKYNNLEQLRAAIADDVKTVRQRFDHRTKAGY
jgi:riboflavin kinase/FMN adenylyltransferase